MSHEIIVYGFIEGATWRTEEYRKYQYMNLEIISELDDEEWPFLTKRMFSSADPDNFRETFRRQVLHFGASTKEQGYEYIDLWILKFETLLSKLYWFTAIAHIETEIYGSYKYEWKANLKRKMIDGKFETNYDIDELPPTTTWNRQVKSRDGVIEPFNS